MEGDGLANGDSETNEHETNPEDNGREKKMVGKKEKEGIQNNTQRMKKDWRKMKK